MNSYQAGNLPDLRRVGLRPDFWYPVARSGRVKKGQTLAVSFAGDPIVLTRTESGALFALEDRCPHRQVPLSVGAVCGETLRCGYHGWIFDKEGKCIGVPYVGKVEGVPAGARRYPSREAHGFLWIFPGNPALAQSTPFPDIPSCGDPAYKSRVLDRDVACHYSFMHENLMDMNHQFLHRSLMGGIRAVLLDMNEGPDWVEAVYTFDRVSGKQSFGEKFMVGKRAGPQKLREHDIMIVRTQYPYQTLQFIRADKEKPALDLWLAYVPTDREQRANKSFGHIMVQRPGIPGLLELAWPFISWFTEGIFKQDKWIMQLEQQAHDAQGGDWNNEVFTVIKALRRLLVRCGTSLDARELEAKDPASATF